MALTIRISPVQIDGPKFFRRIEICFPVLNSRLKKRVLTEGLKPYLRDNGQSWEMDSDGDYHLITARSSKNFAPKRPFSQRFQLLSRSELA